MQKMNKAIDEVRASESRQMKADGYEEILKHSRWCLDPWCTRTMRSKLEPMKKVARTLRTHRALILNGFEAKGTISAGIVEGFNNKVKLTSSAVAFGNPHPVQGLGFSR
jgi:transposase